MEDQTIVLGDKTARVQVPSLYEAQLARLRSIAAADDAWVLSPFVASDIVGLPAATSYNLWRTTDSQVEAFDEIGKWMLEEAALLGFDVLISEMLTGVWLCTLTAKEKRR
jgi:hypothetical protein